MTKSEKRAWRVPISPHSSRNPTSTDIYALGIMMYGMLCGELPFTGDTQSVIAQHLTRTPDSIALSRQDIPEALDTLIMAMLEKDAGNRPQGMQEIVGVLESLRG